MSSFSDHINRHSNRLGRHAGVLVTGLIPKLRLNEVVAGSGNDFGLDREIAGVDQQLLTRIGGKREVSTCWIGSIGQPNA